MSGVLSRFRFWVLIGIAALVLIGNTNAATAGETGPYNCWVKSGTGRDASVLYDYYIEFRVPKGKGAFARNRIQALSWDAARCSSLSTVTQVRTDGRYDYFMVIAGARARGLGRYWQRYAWEYGMHLRCYY